jgi:hypothetical protein
MIKFKELFRSSDSKYFLMTAFKFSFVSVLVTSFLTYSYWIYLNLNYSFFISQGFSQSPEFKEAFIDKIFSQQMSFLALVGVYFVGVFFMGLIMAHFVLRPFNQLKSAFVKFRDDPNFNFQVDKISSQKLVIIAGNVLFDFLKNKNKFEVPAIMNQYQRPQLDKIFYLQYASFVFVMSAITILASYLFATHLHASIIDTATSILKTSNVVATFLNSQSDIVEGMVLVASLICVTVFVYFSKGIIADIEGVSYAYYRDIKDIVSGQVNKRLRPRFSDPGKDAASAINETLDFYLKKEEKSVPHSDDLPPSFVKELKGEDGATIYKIFTPNGHRIEGMKYEEVVDFIKKVG